MEKFDPFDPQYKKLDDLPKSEQWKYIDAPDGGFIRREAMMELITHEQEAFKKNTQPIDVAHEKAIEEDKKITAIKNKVGEAFLEYELPVRLFLSKLSPELIEQLRTKKFYHVTSKKNAENILKEGLKMSPPLSEGEEFTFASDMFKKYGMRSTKDYFEAMILGKSYAHGVRAISLSTKPDLYLYQIPERVKFLLRNLAVLVKAPYITDEERNQCARILEQYEKEYDEDENAVYVFEISFLTPPILNQMVGGYTENFDAIEHAKRLLQKQSTDYKQHSDIPAQYIQVSAKHHLDKKVLEEGIKRDAHLSFSPEFPGTPITDTNRLNPRGLEVYNAFRQEHRRAPTQEEIARLL